LQYNGRKKFAPKGSSHCAEITPAEFFRLRELRNRRRTPPLRHLRWIAVVTYRSESGPIEVDHHFEELEELSRLIEAHCNAHGVG
jgi:hypothetical protein